MDSGTAVAERWYALYTKPHKEYMVRDLLQREGVEVYLPEMQVAIRRRGRRGSKPFFHLRPREGLTQSLLEGATDGRLQPAEIEGLRILPAGEKPHNPAELLGSRRMQELLQELSGQADVVLIDSPPVLPITDAAVLAPTVDGVILVIEAGKTRRDMARQAVESLQQVGANVVGAVLNAVPTRGRGYYRYYHYGSHYYADGRDKRNRSRLRRLLPRRHRGEATAEQPDRDTVGTD